jgi:hypothetical protein
MKAARLAGFDHTDNLSPSPARNGEAADRASAPRVLVQFEIAKNLVAGCNFGLGEVLVYAAPNAETNP